jgi:hypothetical protein
MTQLISDRAATKRRIVEVLTHASGLTQVQVSYSYPGAATRNEAIWLGPPAGDREHTDFGSTRPGRDDVWTLPIVAAVAGFASELEADRRCQEIVAAIDDALYTGTQLGESWRHVALYPGRCDGPTGFRVAPNEPAASVAELTIEIRVPLRGA